jgi:serine/threonine-protein kinase
MAPEVLDGRTLDFRSDVFSVGVMLYQMATGVLPFTGKNPHEVLRRVSEGKFADPRTVNRLVSDQLARIIARALARKAEDRFATMQDMVDGLRGYASDAGLETPREELRQYLTDAEDYEKALIPRMVSSLVAAGVREQAAKHRAKALELWNRALAFEPDNHAVLTELRRLERGERLRRWMIGGTVLGVLVGMAMGAFFLARKALDNKRIDSITAASSEAARRQSAAQNAKDRLRGIVAPEVRGSATARVQSTGAAHVLREARRHDMEKSAGRIDENGKPGEAGGASAVDGSITLTLGFNPARVEVWMDGKKAFDYGPQQNRIQVPWNKAHQLEFRNDSCCNRKEVVVGPQLYRPPGDHLFVTLDPKPARLVVVIDPPAPGATVLIREMNDAKPKPWRARALPGEKVPVPFDAGDEMRKSLEVVVFKGDKTTTNQVTITAGETRPVTIHVDE